MGNATPAGRAATSPPAWWTVTGHSGWQPAGARGPVALARVDPDAAENRRITDTAITARPDQAGRRSMVIAERHPEAGCAGAGRRWRRHRRGAAPAAARW